ncbi:hypothetical protein [Actinomadura verrucosospora]|uniref:Uncharacterized protein n=1 Tax=Actinomadura verrucosospora TaxID=46165 RepID=A0A7D3VQW8_ACTVE|nr:hypothetical protein [Actinomadura verrucosospora]QKG20093.1 hypothetical protein ACTIVE_1729 [Actinomadura verrucosospora]
MSDPGDPDAAVAAALDAYQRELLPRDVPHHDTDPALATSLIGSLIEQLARYAAQHGLDVHDTLDELHQRSIDRGGVGIDPVHNFRLGAQVQFRQEEITTGAMPRYPRWRGFITSLTEAPGGDARCTVRVPAVADTVHATASELEPADPLLPVATRTAGVVHHARDAEETIAVLTAWLDRNADTTPVACQEKLDDVERLSTPLAAWSGGQPEQIARHLPRVPEPARRTGTPAADTSGLAPVARLAATGFPQGPTPIRPDDPAPAPVTRLPDRSKRRPRRP